MEWVKLSRWMVDVDQHHELAVDAGVVLNKAELNVRVSRWVAWLQCREGQRWAVYHQDIYEYLAILLALWHLQRTACVPGDNQAGNIEKLRAVVDGFAGEFPTQNSYSSSDELPVTGLLPEAINWHPLNTDYPALEIYTSGSSGEPQAIVKTIGQLESEASALDKWQVANSGSVVISTVSHQHLYGMTFRLFWPMSAGKLFERTVCQYGESVIQLAKIYERFCLVSSPALLARMNKALAWHEVASGCEYILSSAAPLPLIASQCAEHLLKAPVREIYGSSETGAIAWREQLYGECWQTLPGVELRSLKKGGLQVQSTHLIEAVVLPDKIEFTELNRFKLLGRIDRIAKVEGKRVSLNAVERCLKNNSMITDIKALILHRKRTEVAVVIELTAEGRQWLRRAGRKAVIRSFKTQLAAYFEAVTLPRRWRFPYRMPYNQQGKLPLDNLNALFVSEPQKWPLLLSEKLNETVELECFIPADTEYFDGHFAEHPILPGVVQVHWAEAFGRQHYSIEGRFIRLEVIKFQQVITPEMVVLLLLDYSPEKQKLSFKYMSSKGVHSSGRICFE